jgi:Domain of unknown function (DUF1707)
MDGTRRLWPRSDLRVGDADRQAVVAELQRHYIDGRLTSEELGERVSNALQAKTFADFAPLLSDLPALPPEQPAAIQPHEGPPPEEGGWRPELFTPQLSVILLVIGMLALLWVFMMPGMRFGFFPWPLLIWGVFMFGRPHRGGRNRRF